MDRVVLDNQMFIRPISVPKATVRQQRPAAAIAVVKAVEAPALTTSELPPVWPTIYDQPVQLQDYYQPAPNYQTIEQASKYSAKLKIAVLSLAMVLMACSGVVLLQQFSHSGKASAVAEPMARANFITATSPIDQVKPTAYSISSYQVAPDLPKRLFIPSLALVARVQGVNVNESQQLGVAPNLYDVGWYQKSAKPGDQNGVTLINSYATGYTTKGDFYDMTSLLPGNIIQITRGDNRVFNYRIIKAQSYDLSKLTMSTAMTSAIEGKPGLNIVTHPNRSDADQQSLAVFAVAE